MTSCRVGNIYISDFLRLKYITQIIHPIKEGTKCEPRQDQN